MKTTSQKINIPDSEGHYRVFKHDNVQNVDPSKHFSTIMMPSMFSINMDLLEKTAPFLPVRERIGAALERAKKSCQEIFEKMVSTPIPDGLLNLLKLDRKKEQKKSLKDLTITSDELFAFTCFAHETEGYLYSDYKFQHDPVGSKIEDLPQLIELKEGEKGEEIISIGETPLSKGQQKKMITDRSVTIAKVIKNGSRWHCFFYTYNGIQGLEQYKGGAHIHYISDSWGVPFDTVIDRLKNRKYNVSSVHIGFIR